MVRLPAAPRSDRHARPAQGRRHGSGAGSLGIRRAAWDPRRACQPARCRRCRPLRRPGRPAPIAGRTAASRPESSRYCRPAAARRQPDAHRRTRWSACPTGGAAAARTPGPGRRPPQPATRRMVSIPAAAGSRTVTRATGRPASRARPIQSGRSVRSTTASATDVSPARRSAAAKRSKRVASPPQRAISSSSVKPVTGMSPEASAARATDARTSASVAGQPVSRTSPAEGGTAPLPSAAPASVAATSSTRTYVTRSPRRAPAPVVRQRAEAEDIPGIGQRLHVVRRQRFTRPNPLA